MLFVYLIAITNLCLLAKSNVIHMVIHVDIRHVGSLIPFGLARHIIRDDLPVDGEVLKTNVLHFSAWVITSYDAHVWLFASISDVAKRDVLDASAWGGAILLVEANSNIEEHALADVLYVEVLEGDVLYQDVVAIIDADAPLVVYLVLGMFQDVDSIIDHVGDFLILWGFAMKTDHDRVSNVCPIHTVLDGDVLATAMIVLAGAIDGGAVVAGTSEEVLLVDVVAGESIAPSIPAHHLGVLHLSQASESDAEHGDVRTISFLC